MAKKKKNSNYVTAKTTEKKQAAKKHKESAKRKKLVKSIVLGVSIAIVVLAALFAIIYFGGGFEYVPDITNHVEMYIGDDGDYLHIDHYGKDAPITATHFRNLMSSNYYVGKGSTAIIGGSVYFGSVDTGKPAIQGEFAANGIKNKIPIQVGSIVMARGDAYDSAYGGFFIVTEDTDISSLEGNYAVFGRVTEGMDKLMEMLDAITPNADGTIPESEQIKINSLESH
jgi:cyclophilin family peptidyl-prolyl cis-trans isomerase